MDGKKLQERAEQRTQELPGAELTFPFGKDWDVYKVRGKVFMLQTAVTGEPIVILKATPADARRLRQAHQDITPGYHMNKHHWITLHPDGDLDGPFIDDLVTESYLLVVEKLPEKQRPVIRTCSGSPSCEHQPVRQVRRPGGHPAPPRGVLLRATGMSPELAHV